MVLVSVDNSVGATSRVTMGRVEIDLGALTNGARQGRAEKARNQRSDERKEDNQMIHGRFSPSSG